MSMKLRKKEFEQRVFEVLAPLAGLQIVRGTISQPDPPDIVCDIVGRGRIGFELVSIDAEETRVRLDNMLATDEAWERALATWPPDSQPIVARETQDIFFVITFSNDAGLRDRTRALRRIQEFLVTHPGHEGVLPPEATGRDSKIRAAIAHRRPAINGPKFSHFSVGSWLPPQVAKIEEKLRPGRYCETDIPMELFAYAVHDEPDLQLGSLEQLQDAITKMLPGSAFRRAYIFDFGFRKLLYKYPA